MLSCELEQLVHNTNDAVSRHRGMTINETQAWRKVREM